MQKYIERMKVELAELSGKMGSVDFNITRDNWGEKKEQSE